MYPYVPPHVTKPKEQKKLFVVQLPEKCKQNTYTHIHTTTNNITHNSRFNLSLQSRMKGLESQGKLSISSDCELCKILK